MKFYDDDLGPEIRFKDIDSLRFFDDDDDKGACQKKKYGIFWEFFPYGGGRVSPNPKTFVI